MHTYTAGDTVRIHKDDLLQGENEIQLSVFGNLGGRLTLTSTLMVGAQPPPGQCIHIAMCVCLYRVGKSTHFLLPFH